MRDRPQPARDRALAQAIGEPTADDDACDRADHRDRAASSSPRLGHVLFALEEIEQPRVEAAGRERHRGRRQHQPAQRADAQQLPALDRRTCLPSWIM